MAFAYNPPSLKEAIEGKQEVESRLDELQGGAAVEADSIVRFLRQIPAEDKAKKRELAKFFKTGDGQRYGKDDRKRYYDELLGAARNRGTIG